MRKFLLMLMLLSTMMFSVALADTYGDWVYSEYNGEVTIERYVGDGGRAVVPDSINNSPVVYIGPSAFKGCTNLTSVHLGSNVMFLGYEAFRDCTALASINFPASLKTIDHCVFINTGFRELILPEGIESIGSYVFENCAQLQTVTLPNSITSMGHGCLQNLPALESLTCPTIVVSNEPWTCWWSSTDKPWKLKTLHVTGGEGAIHYELCSDLEHLETVILGEGITETGHDAFADCPKLTNVQLPSTLTKISSQSFCSASSLRSIIIPANVTCVDNFAFSDCTSLSDISLPTGVTSIGYYAFDNCSSLRTFVFPSTLKSIGECAFTRSGLTSVSLPDGLETMARGAFSRLESLTYLRVPGSLTEIPNGAFSNCPNLETLILCDGIEIIGDEAFTHAGKNKSMNLRLPMTLRKIGTQALRDIGVSSIVLPNSLTTVNCEAITSSRSGTFTIYTCPSITEISQDGSWAPPFSYNNTTIWCVKNSAIHNYVKKPDSFYDNPPTIKTYGSSNGVLHLLDAQTTLAPGATYTIPLVYANASMSRTFTSNNTAIATVNSEGVITAKGVGTTTITITGGGKTATFTVNVALPIDSVTLGFSQITVSVGDTFRIPVSVTPSSAASAWAPVATTSNAGTATVSGRVVTAVAAGSAEITLADPADNTKFVRLTVHVTGDSTLKLPSGATTVKSEAFSGIKAKCITVPASVKTISSRAFTGNTALKLVRFDGDSISIANDAFDGCGDIFFLCKKNSAAHTYAQQHGITCVFIP